MQKVMESYFRILAISMLAGIGITGASAQEGAIDTTSIKPLLQRPLQLNYTQEVHEHYDVKQVVSSNPETGDAVIARPNVVVNNQPVTATATLMISEHGVVARRITTTSITWTGQGDQFHLVMADFDGYPITTVVYDGKNSVMRIDRGQGRVSESRLPGSAMTFHVFAPSRYLYEKLRYESAFATDISESTYGSIRQRVAKSGNTKTIVDFNNVSGDLIRINVDGPEDGLERKYRDFVMFDNFSLPTNISNQFSGDVETPIRGIYYLNIQYERLSNEEFASLMKLPEITHVSPVPVPVLQNLKLAR